MQLETLEHAAFGWAAGMSVGIVALAVYHSQVEKKVRELKSRMSSEHSKDAERLVADWEDERMNHMREIASLQGKLDCANWARDRWKEAAERRDARVASGGAS